MRFEVLTIPSQVTQKLHTPFGRATSCTNTWGVGWVTMKWEGSVMRTSDSPFVAVDRNISLFSCLSDLLQHDFDVESEDLDLLS